MLKKIMIALLTILIALVVMFLVIHNMPGDPVDIMATEIMKTESIQYEIAYGRAKEMDGVTIGIVNNQSKINSHGLSYDGSNARQSYEVLRKSG